MPPIVPRKRLRDTPPPESKSKASASKPNKNKASASKSQSNPSSSTPNKSKASASNPQSKTSASQSQSNPSASTPNKSKASASNSQSKTSASKSQSKPPARTPNNKRKATLYDELDAVATPHSRQSGSILPEIDGDDSDSALTSLSDEEFEDVVVSKRRKTHNASKGGEDDDGDGDVAVSKRRKTHNAGKGGEDEDSDDDDDDDIEFEDVAAPTKPAADAPVTSGDLELTLDQNNHFSSFAASLRDKKGVTKREKKVRIATHCLHVMTLLWHNAIRNSWICDQEVQGIMVSHLTPTLWEEVDRWRRNSGLEAPPTPPKSQTKARTRSSRRSEKGKGKMKPGADGQSSGWDKSAKKLEEGVVDMSHGDPIFRLMQSLMSWWKQRFRVTAPGLRKRGYMPMERLDRQMKAHKTEFDDAQRFGEYLPDIETFRKCAQDCRGSRDVGSQLFTALLRGLGLEARMVSNLQCLGFGWNKFEDAEAENIGLDKSGEKDKSPEEKETPEEQKSGKPKAKKVTTPAQIESTRKTRSSNRTQERQKILQPDFSESENESIVEMDFTPKEVEAPTKRFDPDLEYPHYWTEVLSPVTNKYLPIDPTAKGIVATNRDLVESLAPRGAKADKARQIMAYVVGHSSDGTAKDVTVRYLKNQVFPGRTKGARMPPEKIPVYNHNGKVKRYEQYDWFRSVMAGYIRGTRKYPVTEIDELENSTDLKPAKPEKKEVKEGQETLQYYKQSKEFVLQRHLKREEALKSDARPVKVFKNKSKGGKVEDEDVYLRADVLQVKSTETWHKQGRAPRPGEQPLKRVPYRAATLNRRREILEAEATTGEKVLQGLFSRAQTEWIIPPPIENGKIPKNEYGNIDLFAEHMCPKGAIHVPYRGAVRVCKRLQIDYAEAVVDFEFGHRMAVPVIQGVVIAEEYHDQLMVELEKDEAERARKEDEKRRKAVLGRWRKFIMGLRIVERIRQDYGDIDDSVAVFGHAKKKDAAAPAHDEDMAGGFLPEGYEEEDEEADEAHATSSFFPVGGGSDDEDDEDDGGLIMEVENEQGKHGQVEDERVENEQVENDRQASKAADPHTAEDDLVEDDLVGDDLAKEEAGRKGGKGTKTGRGPTTGTRRSARRRTQRRQKAAVSDSEEEDG